MKSKLKLFEINNLFNQFNVRLPLDEKVNIFLGENGMGKTTILNCLYYVLSGNIEKLNNIIFDGISLTFIDGEKISINHNDISSYVEDYIYDETNVELGIYKDKAKKPIGIQNLSSGEKQIISVFSKLYIENIEKCIILFDEPELSLSIKWQNMFLPDVVNSGKCSTLIAVTHSPFIFDNEFDDLAKDMGNCLSENE